MEEFCDGVGTDCPEEAFSPAGTECRPQAGECDMAEFCSGLEADCPADAFEPHSTLCRPASGACDAAEYCTGASASCPLDSFEPDTKICRPPAGPCDIAEFCTGSSPDCPGETARDYLYETPMDAFASSEYNATYVARNAIDADTNTSWLSIVKTPPEWIYFDIGDQKCMDGINVMFDLLGSITVDIQVSDDAAVWTTLIGEWTTTLIRTWIEIPFDETAARYIRLYETDFTGGARCGNCAELEVHASSLL